MAVNFAFLSYFSSSEGEGDWDTLEDADFELGGVSMSVNNVRGE